MAELQRLIDDCLGADDAALVRRVLAQRPATPEAQRHAWRMISKAVLRPEHPFELHKALLDAVYASWDADSQGPRPVWVPTSEGARETNLARFMATYQGEAWEAQRTGDLTADYALLQRLSCSEPETFWPQLLQQMHVQFAVPPGRVLQPARSPDAFRWFPGSQLNIAASALDTRDPDAPAILWAEEASPADVRCLSRGQLAALSRRVAAALRACGLRPGQAVAICMPMTVGAVAAYFGTVLAGCAAVGVADSFSGAEIGARLRIADARLLLTQDVLQREGRPLPLFQRATQQAGVPAVVLPGLPGQPLQAQLRPQDLSWEAFLAAAPLAEAAAFQAVPAEPDAPTNILFSSGTTGEPKAIPWTHVTPIRAAADSWAQLDVRPGDCVAFPTNLGWMMGPFLAYGALLNGAAIALFHGSPLGKPFCRFVAAARVTMLGTIPSIVRAWRRGGCTQGLDWGGIRCFASTGEASSPEDSHWLTAQAGYKPVIELCGGTELGGGFLSGSLLQPQVPAAFSTPTLGAQLVLLPEGVGGWQSPHGAGEPVTGELAIAPPMLGCSQRLLNGDNAAIYYQGMPLREGLPLRRHGDVFQRLPGGFYRAQGRADDTMNLGGIKVSSVELERACIAGVPAVSEAAAVAVPQAGGGPDALVMFVVPASSAASNAGGAEAAAQLRRACQAAIRRSISPLFKLERVVVCQALPRTATNKVMRRVLRQQAMAQSQL